MKQTIEIQVPSGKKVVMNQMEKGMLFTFEDKNNLELLQDDMDYVRSSILSYMGIPKKIFGNYELEQKLERQKCFDDKTRIYMIEKYFKVFDATQMNNDNHGMIPFKLMDHQKLILRSLVDNKGTIVKSYRQAGNTALMAAYYACELILTEGTDILYMSSSLQCSSMFMKLVSGFIDQWLLGTNQPIFDYDKNWVINNGNEIKLATGTNIRVINPNKVYSLQNIELDKITHIIYDNSAFIEFDDGFRELMGYKLPENIKTTIISTDQKVKNWFKDKWDSADKQGNKLNKIELEWFNDPRYNKDLKWVKVSQEVIENGINKIKQAYLPTNEWYVGMCRIWNNKERIEQEIGIGYNPNENYVEIKKNDIREHILQLNNELQKLKNL